ncbi:hypothetical protein Lal_00016906 [Lupinus albus]|nr:hypothetical protein Lal_00016906 [Lupinus albus]
MVGMRKDPEVGGGIGGTYEVAKNQTQHSPSLVKYLFKYINKGYDRITIVIEPIEDGGSQTRGNIDEVKQYLDCRYVSPLEACWITFQFPIHGRQPIVERLHFHLLGEQSIYFNDYEENDNVLSRPTISESMFTS